MSIIEIVLLFLLTLVGVMILAICLIFKEIGTIKRQNKVDIYKVKKDISEHLEVLARNLGYPVTLYAYGDGDSYLSLGHINNRSIKETLNLLMDHLNLEIKEGEPSKTTLVKKKPIKKST